MFGLLAVLLVHAAEARRFGSRPQFVYVDQGASWVARGLGKCSGEQQSPLNFADATAATALGIAQMKPSTDRLWYKYPPVGYPLRLVNDGHTVGVTFPETYKGGLGVSGGANVNEMLQDANFYRLWKMTVHHPSEHRLHGKTFPLELQLIHQNPLTEQTGILAVWVELGEPSPFFATLLEGGLPQRSFEEVNFNTQASPIHQARSADAVGLALASLMELPAGSDLQNQVMAYNGSLTVPPCEENVKWWVRRAPVKASKEQIEQFVALITDLDGPMGNTRVLQQAKNRVGELMAIVDPASDADLPPPPEVVTDGVTAPGPEAICSQLKEFESESAFESAEVTEAKKKYALLEQQATSTKIWVANAKQALAQSQGLYDGSAGMVEKINMKWDVIGKQTELETAVSQMTAAVAAADAACDEALPIVCTQEDVSQQCKDALGTLNAAETASAVTTTTAPTTGPPVVDPGLAYLPKVVLPKGAAGNPFSDRVAERVSRIGGKGMSSGVQDLANSLRQPLMPGAGIPMEASKPLTTPAPTTTETTVSEQNAVTNPPPATATALKTTVTEQNAVTNPPPATATALLARARP
jgi:carbonic anhydrase